MSLYHHSSARSQAQLDEMKRLTEAGICIFCPENIHQDSEKIELQTPNWMVKKNRYPYKDTKLHLLLIPKVHVRTLPELPKAAQTELFSLIKRCEKKYKLRGYALGIRSGDMRFNAGSIDHLHIHLVVGDVDDPNHEPVRFKMSNRPS